MIEKYYSWCV